MNNFLQDSLGNKSSKRLMSFICLVVAIALALAYVISKGTIETHKYAVTFIVAALALQGIAWGSDIGILKNKNGGE